MEKECTLARSRKIKVDLWLYFVTYLLYLVASLPHAILWRKLMKPRNVLVKREHSIPDMAFAGYMYIIAFQIPMSNQWRYHNGIAYCTIPYKQYTGLLSHVSRYSWFRHTVTR